MKYGDQTGLFFSIPEAEYHALKIPSNSSIRKYAKLPALYELEYLKQEESDVMKQHFQMGKVFELLVLEPDRAGDIVTFKTKTYDSKDAQACRDANPGKIPISESDLPLVETWARCMLAKYPRNEANKAQASGIVSFDLGVRECAVKFRLDEVDLENRIIYDYKLMQSIDPSEFEKHAWDIGYDTQAALYTKAMDQLFPSDDPDKRWKFVFRVQQKHSYGFDTRFTTKYWFSEESLERAWSHIQIQLELIACETEFRGYSEMCLTTDRFKWGRG